VVDNEKKIKSKGKRKEAKKRGLKTSPRNNQIVSRNHTRNIDDTNNFNKRAF